MGTFITILLGIVILGYTVYQLRKIIIKTRKGKCVGCPDEPMCKESKSESVTQIKVHQDEK